MTVAVRPRPASLRTVAVAALVAATGLTLPSASAAMPDVTFIPHPFLMAERCSSLDLGSTRQTLERLLEQLEAVRSEHEQSSLQLAIAWRADSEMLLRLNAANDRLNTILGARTFTGQDPRLPAADRLLKEAEQAVARRMALIGALALANARLRDTAGQNTYESLDARDGLVRARLALEQDGKAFGAMERLLGTLALRRAERTTIQYPGLSADQTRTIESAYLERALVEATRTALLTRIEDLRARVRSSYLGWRLLQAWEPQIRSCLATLDGAAPGVAGPSTAPAAADPADRRGPIDIVAVKTRLMEFNRYMSGPVYSGSLGMDLVFHPGGAVSGTVFGGATVRGRWGGGQAEGEITGLPGGRVAHWKFTGLRLEQVDRHWTLVSDGLWCGEEGDGRFLNFGYIAAPGSPVAVQAPAQPAPPMEALKLCDTPWQG